MLIELRYNSEHKSGGKPWKVFIDKQLLLVDAVEFNCPISQSTGLTSDGKTTWHVLCNSNKITLENGVLVVEQ